ncbi:hypothetical protein SAMN04488510_10126 [Fervidobacterium changbaicum]|uniref:ABC transporter ATP-binding protein n=1 Tax=Fervidobacterium changbaicum TaxID=310769 RepID=A0ABX5QSA1_9BACT|nr:ABC transporter ATP-binding protein [Fervidobacterium changbaicum]SDG89269.1 hypothetical protein SAMN04488510_10126 [Fervidobacterium changbaicum]
MKKRKLVDFKVFDYLYLSCFVLGTMLVSVSNTFQPLIIKQFLDNIKIFGKAICLMNAYVITILVIIIGEYLSKIFRVRYSLSIKEKLREKILQSVVSKKLTEIKKDEQQIIISQLNTDIDVIR